MATDRGEYRPMFCRILNGPDFRRLSGVARACVWPLKLRLPSAGIGVIPALAATLADDTGFSEETVREALAELETRPIEGASEGAGSGVEARPEWLRREDSVIWLVRGLEFEPTLNPNDAKHRLHICRTVAALPSVPLVESFKSRYAAWFSDLPHVTSHASNGAASNGLTRVSQGPSQRLRSKTPTPNPTTIKKQIRTPSALFEQAWAAYPKRPNNAKGQALRAWQARVADGEDEQAMLIGTIAYAGYVGREGTEPRYVKLGATFYGPDKHYLSDYSDLTPARQSGGQTGLQDEPDLEWVTEGEVPHGR